MCIKKDCFKEDVKLKLVCLFTMYMKEIYHIYTKYNNTNVYIKHEQRHLHRFILRNSVLFIIQNQTIIITMTIIISNYTFFICTNIFLIIIYLMKTKCSLLI